MAPVRIVLFTLLIFSFVCGKKDDDSSQNPATSFSDFSFQATADFPVRYSHTLTEFDGRL